MNQEIISLLKTAIECSVLIDPTNPGLTFLELQEIGKRAGYQEGEVNDALPHVGAAFFGVPRVLPNPIDRQSWIFFFPEEPDYRNFEAFDFVVSELNALTRSEGIARARIERSVLVQRGAAKGIPQRDIQAAITWQVLSDQLTEKDGIIGFSGGHGVRGFSVKGLRT